MKIRNYVSDVANLLSLWDNAKVDMENIKNNDDLTIMRINKLIDIINGIIFEIAKYFIPLIVSRAFKTSDGVVYISQLREKFVSVERIIDENGKEVRYTTKDDKIIMDNNSATIYYRILPCSYAFANEIDFTNFEVPRNVIIYGAAAEMCLSEGMFDEAVVWHEKYREQLKMLTKMKNYKLAKRTWA